MDTVLSREVEQSTAFRILNDLEEHGFRVELVGESVLSIAPRSRLTPERMQAVSVHKETLKNLLRQRDPGVQARLAVFVEQLAAAPAPTLPAFLFLPGVPYVKGTCFSCRDRLANHRFGRCWRCSLALRLACRLPLERVVAEAMDASKVCA